MGGSYQFVQENGKVLEDGEDWGQRVPHPSVKQRLRSPPWVSPISSSKTQGSSSSPPISIWHHSSLPYRSAPGNTLLSLHKRQNSHHCSALIYLKGSRQPLCLPRVKEPCAQHHPAGYNSKHYALSPSSSAKGWEKHWDAHGTFWSYGEGWVLLTWRCCGLAVALHLQSNDTEASISQGRNLRKQAVKNMETSKRKAENHRNLQKKAHGNAWCATTPTWPSHFPIPLPGSARRARTQGSRGTGR